MRYVRPKDARNPALDLGEREAFELDLGDGNGAVKYPREWPRADLVAKLGFVEQAEPEPPPPPAPEPKDVPLTQRQLRLALFLPAAQGGMGFAEADIALMIAGLPTGQKEAAAIEFAYADSFHWDHPLVQSLRETVRATKGITVQQLKAAWLAAGNL